MRVIGEVQAAAIQPRGGHEIRHGSVNLGGSAQFLAGEVDFDERIARHAVRADAQREGVEHLLHRDIAPGVGVAHGAAGYYRQIYRHTVIVGGVLHRVHIGIRDNIAQIVFGVHLAQILQVGENNIVFCQHLIFGVAELRQIIFVHRVHKAVDDLLRFRIGGNIGSDGDQLVIGHLPAAVRFLRHGKAAQIFAVLAAGDHIGVPVPDGLPDAAVGVAAEDKVEVGHTFSQQLVLRLFGVVPCAAVGNADDHIRIFVRLDLCYGGFDRLYRVLEFQFTGGRAGERILAENAHHGNAHIALLHHGVVLHAVGGKGIFEQLLPLSEAGGLHGIPIHIADHDGRDGIAGGAGAGKHIGKPLGAVIELVVAEGGHIVAHVAQHPQLCGLRFKHRLDQGAHGKVTAIDHKGVRIFGALRLDEGVGAGKAADVRFLVLHNGGEGVQVGVGVVAEQDVQRFARLRCLPIGGGNAQQHRKQQQHGHRHGEKLFHGVFSFCCVLIFSAQPNFYSIRKSNTTL